MVGNYDAFDLFDLLQKLNKRDFKAFDNLTDAGKKAASPLVIMRWLSGTNNYVQLIRLNEFVNCYIFSLNKELLFQLMAAACIGSGRASWLKGPGAKKEQLSIKAIQAKYECSSREGIEYLKHLSASDIMLFGEEAGWNKEELKKLQVELGVQNGSGKTTSGSRTKKK